MAENLLLDLERKLPADGEQVGLESLSAWKESLDIGARAYAKEVRLRVRGILGAAQRFKEIWDACCKLVVAGHTKEVHGARDRFLGAFAMRLAYLGQARELVRFASRQASAEVPEGSELDADIAVLEPMLHRLVSRWQTEEDLEDLVAESLAPSPEKLEAVARTYGGPSAWYRAEAKRP
jgi:hypothetical protein